MSEEWVPFQERLAKGDKRGLPRGVRFVYLELALEARRRSGFIDLTLGWTTEKAVHDLIGGNRREIKKALQAFTKPDEDGLAPIEIVRDESKHRLILTKWPHWAGPKSSTQRVRDYRERQRNADLSANETLHPVSRRNGETPYSTEQYRTGQERTEQPPLAPQGGEGEPSASDVPESVEREEPAAEPTYDLAWRMWRELYEQSRRRYGRYVEAIVDDNRVIQRLGRQADEMTGADRARTSALLRHWFVSYLRDDGDLRCQVAARHPLRLIERRLPTYGEPKPPASANRVAKAKANAEPVPSEEELRASAQRNLERMRSNMAAVAAKKGFGS
jgi:hypothetical protein